MSKLQNIFAVCIHIIIRPTLCSADDKALEPFPRSKGFHFCRCSVFLQETHIVNQKLAALVVNADSKVCAPSICIYGFIIVQHYGLPNSPFKCLTRLPRLLVDNIDPVVFGRGDIRFLIKCRTRIEMIQAEVNLLRRDHIHIEHHIFAVGTQAGYTIVIRFCHGRNE